MVAFKDTEQRSKCGLSAFVWYIIHSYNGHPFNRFRATIVTPCWTNDVSIYLHNAKNNYIEWILLQIGDI